MSGYFGISQAISSYLRLPWAILGYFELSLGLSRYNELSRLSLAISSYIWLSLAVYGYLSHVSSIRVQVEAEENNLLLFEFLPSSASTSTST